MALLKMENFTALLIFKKSLGILILILMLVWLQKYRGGFGWQSFPSLQFNWHPILTLIGMIIMNGNAILAYRALKNAKKYTAKLIHGGLNIFGFVSTVIGLKAVFDSHNYASPPIPNLYSLHSWIGLLSVIMFACQWVGGLLAFLYPGGSAPIRAKYHPVHIYFGIIGFAFATCAAMLGFLEKAIFSVQNYSAFPAEGVLMNMMGVMLLIYSTLVLYLVIEPKYKRPLSNEDQNLLEPKPWMDYCRNRSCPLDGSKLVIKKQLEYRLPILRLQKEVLYHATKEKRGLKRMPGAELKMK